MSVAIYEASRVINAPAQKLYDILKDYEVGHPAILPKGFFGALEVKQGGQGAGTVISVSMKAFGQTTTIEQVVTEPEPGRVLVETDMQTGQFTRFVVERLDSARSRVTIHTETPASPGLKGWFERNIQPPLANRVFQQELQNLEAYARRQ